MALYTIGDLHLSFSMDKPMDIFGAAWKNHTQVLEANWKAVVRDEDTVVLAGDHSWALKTEDAISDLTFIHNLPGRKILMKGNHDLWWPTARKLQQLCDANGLTTLSFMQGSAQVVQDAFGAGVDAVVCGTRGWICPGDRDFGKMDEAVYRREGLRLNAALQQAHKESLRLSELGRQAVLVGFMHYPPMGNGNNETIFTQLFEQYEVGQVFYGHLHGLRARETAQSTSAKVRYHLISGDFIAFKPVLVGFGN